MTLIDRDPLLEKCEKALQWYYERKDKLPFEEFLNKISVITEFKLILEMAPVVKEEE